MSPQPKYDRVAIVGAGIIGLCTAYYLAEAGIDVVLIERDRVGSGASRGNAGEIVPGASTPLPAPGVIGPALKTMHRSDSALFVRLRPNLALARFLIGFAWNARARRYLAGVRALGELSRDGVHQFQEMAEAGIESSVNTRPYLQVYRSEDAARRSIEWLRRTCSEYVEVPDQILNQRNCRRANPC